MIIEEFKNKWRDKLNELMDLEDGYCGLGENYLFICKNENDLKKEVGEWGLDYKEREMAEWYRNLSEEQKRKIEILFKINYHKEQLDNLKSKLDDDDLKFIK
jgi:hypothetical protein